MAQPALRQSNDASAGTPAGPETNLAVTHALLKQFYAHMVPLSDLLPSSTAVLRAGDSDAFKQLVEETVVASLAEQGVPQLKPEPITLGDVSMRDVSVVVRCMAALHS